MRTLGLLAVGCAIVGVLLVSVGGLRNKRPAPREDYHFSLVLAEEIANVERTQHERTGSYLSKGEAECVIQRKWLDRGIRDKYVLALEQKGEHLEITLCSGIHPWCRVLTLERGEIQHQGSSVRQREEVSIDMRLIARCSDI